MSPSLYNWLAWCYSRPCPLFSQGQFLALSKAGVHQGDAMGPVGFALGLEGALDACSEQEKSLEWAAWYLDDGTLVGSPGAVASYLEKLVPALQSVGLEINLNKCQLWGPGLHQGHGDTFMKMAEGHPFNSIPIVPFTPRQGITVLGVPVDVQGSVEAGQGKWDTATRATIDLLKKLRQLPDGQLRHCLLRHCLDACRVTHLMRSKCHKAAVNSMDMLSQTLR